MTKCLISVNSASFQFENFHSFFSVAANCFFFKKWCAILLFVHHAIRLFLATLGKTQWSENIFVELPVYSVLII